MTASDSFHATTRFSVLALACLFLGNLASSLLGGNGASAWGVFFALLSIGAAYGSQLMTTNGLQLRHDVACMVDATREQATKEAAGFCEGLSVWLQYSSIGAAAMSGVLLFVSLP